MGKKKRRRSTREVEKTEEEIFSTPGVDGSWGWFVVFNSFICNMIVDGVQYTFGNFLVAIALYFKVSVTEVSLIGSLLSGFYNFSGPIAGAIGNKFGFRMVVITGSIVSSFGLGISYFAVNVHYLYFFYGILGGLGFGMIYMASVITTSLYFEKYRAVAASLSVCGTGVGTFVFSPFGNYLIHSVGWRYALVSEAGIILICILCGLSFKPLEIIKVIPVSKPPSNISLHSVDSGARGSMYYTSEPKRHKGNEDYPTFREALQMQGGDNIEDRRPTILSLSIRSPVQSNMDATIRRQRIYSVRGSMMNLHRPPQQRERACRRNCRICCFNFWHCRCKRKDLTLGDRPLYRDDIFYGGSLSSLTAYTSAERINYHLSVTRIPDVQDVEEHAQQKCCVCHQAVVRTIFTMMGFNLLKSVVFVFLCISSFFYTMGLFIPYVFIVKVAKDTSEISEDIAVWLVSAIGISNTAGRLVSGVMKSFTKINGGIFAMVCLIISGLFTFTFLFTVNLPLLMSFACIYGFFTAPFISLRPVIIVEFLGLEKLTNAFGLVLLSQGVASIIGPPAAGALNERTHQSLYALYLSGSLMLASAASLLIGIIIHRRKQANT